jgi:hypothetical protein
MIGPQLADGLILHRSRIMDDYCVGSIGFSDAMVPPLKALGLIISCKLRLFIRRPRQGPPSSPPSSIAFLGVTDRTPSASREAIMTGPASELARRLGEHAEAVCREYLSNGHRSGNYWMVGDVRNACGRSMHVRLEAVGGKAAGKWVDESSEEYGHLLDVIKQSCVWSASARSRRKLVASWQCRCRHPSHWRAGSPRRGTRLPRRRASPSPYRSQSSARLPNAISPAAASCSSRVRDPCASTLAASIAIS